MSVHSINSGPGDEEDGDEEMTDFIQDYDNIKKRLEDARQRQRDKEFCR